MEFDIQSLNEAQIEALNAVDGAVLVTAGAGSGKTRLLTHRIVHLIKNLHVAPENILAITFTNKAAAEMKERVAKMLPEGQRVWISTFHSMCAKLLRIHINALDPRFNSNFSIYADAETQKIITELMANRNIKKDDTLKKSILFHISNCKNNNMSLEKYELENSHYSDINLIMSIFREYQSRLVESNAVDFDDLMILTYRLFKEHPEILNKYATRFKYLLVDEFQDTNEIQYDLVKMLSSLNKNIFVVGDEDQCIYTWRGANFKNIFRFRKDFENVKLFKLERNYRSTKAILDCANKLIKNNKTRIEKNLWSDIETTSPIERKELYDEQEEAEFIARTIYNLVEKHGYCYSDFAILLRLNALSLPFEEKLLAYNIPHKIYGGFKFYERVEVKNVLAYLKLFVNQKDDQAFARIINFPKRGLGDAAISHIKDASLFMHQSMLEVCLNSETCGLPVSIAVKLNTFASIYKHLFSEYETTPLEEFVASVIEKFGIKNAYNINNEQELEKVMNIEQLVSSIYNFAEKNAGATLNDYLQSVSLISDMDSMDSAQDNAIVATIHSVKGLEFRAVFVVGLEEKIFPISRAYNNNDEMEEERRLMYVAITRAKERLFFTNCRTRYLYGHRDYMLSSRFLTELGYTNKSAGFNSYSKPMFNNFASRKTNAQVDFVKKSLTGLSAAGADSDKNSGESAGDYAGFANGDANAGKTKPQGYATFAQASAQLHTNGESTHNTATYSVGNIVLHTKFGLGTIESIDEESKTADINFKTIGVKTLMLEIAPLKIVK